MAMNELSGGDNPDTPNDPALQAATDTTTEPTGAHAFEQLLNSLRQAGSVPETPVRSDAKRRAARYVAQLPVRYRWPNGKAWFNGTAANISATGLLVALDYADQRIIRDPSAPADDALELAIELRTTPVQLPASISCAARHVRTTVAPGRVVQSAIGVVVGTWQLKRSRGAAG